MSDTARLITAAREAVTTLESVADRLVADTETTWIAGEIRVALFEWHQADDPGEEPDFFAPGFTYLFNDPYLAPEIRPQFRCLAVAPHPSKDDQRAFGFYRSGSMTPWVSTALDTRAWADGWTGIPTPTHDTIEGQP